MVRKRDVLQSSKELIEPLRDIEVPEEGSILFRSDQYLQLGCDLRDLDVLSHSLVSAIDIDNCTILFIAEVSITYMTADASNSLIQWASTLPEGIPTLHPIAFSRVNTAVAKFCLLEQLMPDGLSHPFAQTMIAHFKKLQTPLGAVGKYPTTFAQHQRFKTLGWSNISAQNLWELWSSPEFLSPINRSSLNLIEPFDEWEEFALFGCHYVLLTADNKTPLAPEQIPQYPMSESRGQPIKLLYSESPNTYGYRRFAAGLPLKSPATMGDRVGNFAGMGLNSRLETCDVYSNNEARNLQFKFFDSRGPLSRMCHTITDLGDAGALLTGGRASPDNALVDCWIYHKWPGIWERVEDLPQPRYRHSAVNLGNGYVLISPGKIDSRNIGSSFMVWNRQFGWKPCIWGTDERPHIAYGSTFTVFANLDAQQKPGLGCGLIAGGMSEDGVVQQDIWQWELQLSYLDQVSAPSHSWVKFRPHNTIQIFFLHELNEFKLNISVARILSSCSKASQGIHSHVYTQSFLVLVLLRSIIMARPLSLAGL
jgi:tRNA wybutosine-synthesizing protein 4